MYKKTGQILNLTLSFMTRSCSRHVELSKGNGWNVIAFGQYEINTCVLNFIAPFYCNGKTSTLTYADNNER